MNEKEIEQIKARLDRLEEIMVKPLLEGNATTQTPNTFKCWTCNKEYPIGTLHICSNNNQIMGQQQPIKVCSICHCVFSGNYHYCNTANVNLQL